MTLKHTLVGIRKKYRELAESECKAEFNRYYCEQFEDVELVEKTADSITINNYKVNNIKIDNYNNLFCQVDEMPCQYLRYFRMILNEHFSDESHCYHLRLGSHFFMAYYRQHYKTINDDYLEWMLSLDDNMVKERGGLSFREWLLGRNNDGRGELRYLACYGNLKNLVYTKEGITWKPSKDNCEICKGENGGVKGNENIIDGKVVCDYCTVKIKPFPNCNCLFCRNVQE